MSPLSPEQKRLLPSFSSQTHPGSQRSNLHPSRSALSSPLPPPAPPGLAPFLSRPSHSTPGPTPHLHHPRVPILLANATALSLPFLPDVPTESDSSTSPSIHDAPRLCALCLSHTHIHTLSPSPTRSASCPTQWTEFQDSLRRLQKPPEVSNFPSRPLHCVGAGRPAEHLLGRETECSPASSGLRPRPGLGRRCVDGGGYRDEARSVYPPPPFPDKAGAREQQGSKGTGTSSSPMGWPLSSSGRACRNTLPSPRAKAFWSVRLEGYVPKTNQQSYGGYQQLLAVCFPVLLTQDVTPLSSPHSLPLSPESAVDLSALHYTEAL